MAQAANDFLSPYGFKASGKTVVLRHHAEKSLRVGKDDDKVGVNGGFGKFARWKVEFEEKKDEKIATFQSEHSSKYLRINKDGEIDAGGVGGKWCKFVVHKVGRGNYKFESKEHNGKYLAVKKDGDELKVGGGGNLCDFDVLKEGAAPSFSKRYGFGGKKTVVIVHKGDQTLRVNPDNNDEVDGTGGYGDWAQWEAVPSDDGKTVQFYSKKLGENNYLRINNKGEVNCGGKGGALTKFKVHSVGDRKNIVKLESEKHDGQFIQVKPKDNWNFTVGDGKDKRCVFAIYKE